MITVGTIKGPLPCPEKGIKKQSILWSKKEKQSKKKRKKIRKKTEKKREKIKEE